MASLLDDLRALEERLLKVSVKELAIPGSGGRIAVRYTMPEDRDKLQPVMRAFGTGEPLSPEEELQLLIDCNAEVRRGDPGTGETEPYDDDGPLHFDASDPRWGDDVTTARQCVEKLFKLKLQPLAISRHVSSIVPWLQGVDAEILARVEGNSSASSSSADEASSATTTSPEPASS
jgi:hypothetical protein